jgi:hypothetical protein
VRPSARPQCRAAEHRRVRIRDGLEDLYRAVAALWRQVDFATGEVRIDGPRSTKNEEARVFSFVQDFRLTLEAQPKLTDGLDSPYVLCHLAGVRMGKRFSYSGLQSVAAGRLRSSALRASRTISGEPQSGIWSAMACRDPWRWSARRREEVYRRYAIVDEAMIRDAAIKMNRGAKVRQTTAQRTAQSDRPSADR